MSEWIIIGSVAAKHHFPGFRVPKDIDIISTVKGSIIGKTGIVAESKTHDLVDRIIRDSGHRTFADPEILYTLKLSHAHWDIHWDKTIFDIGFFEDTGVIPIEELYLDLVRMWEDVHGKKKANLMVPVEEFFTETVHRIHDHDEIHRKVMFGDRPMHELIRPDLGMAWCSREMFESLSREDRARAAMEEMMATAIERGRLNLRSGRVSIISSVHRAHKLLCTSMTKGWFARYLIQNSRDLLHRRKDQWMGRITTALQDQMFWA